MMFQQLTDALQRGLFSFNLAQPEAPLSRDRQGAVLFAARLDLASTPSAC